MEREKQLDGLKYLLIILVVIGHFIEPSRNNNHLSSILYSIIYSFHMPLFIWISGSLHKQRTIRDEVLKCVPLLETCIISHIFFLLLRNGIRWSFFDLINFASDPSWYLLSLVCWRILSSFLLRYFSKYQLLLLSIVVDLLFIITLKHGGILSIGRTVFFYPYFVLGHCLAIKDVMQFKYKGLLYMLGLCALVFVCMTSGIIQHLLLYQRTGIFDIVNRTGHGVLILLLFRYSLIISSLLLSTVVIITLYKGKLLLEIAKYGQYTLFIYFIQTMMFAVIGTMDISFLNSLVLSLVSIPLITYLATLPLARFILNPVSYCYRSFKGIE